MKKTMYALLGMVCMFTSCSNEENIKDQPVSIEGERTVTFSLGVPGREPVTYAQVHESDEYEVAQLDIFQFDNSGSLVKVYKNVSTTDAPAGENIARKSVAQIVLPVGTSGNQQFLFVANNTPNKMVTELSNTSIGTNIDTFKKTLTQQLSENNADISPAFLMTGEKNVNITGNDPLDLSSDVVYLTRVVARIDVGIRLGSTNESLTFTKIELKDAPRDSYLFPQGYESPVKSPAGSNNSSYQAYNSTNLASHFDGVSTTSYTSRYKKLFYLYERKEMQFAAEGTPTLYISGVYKPTPAAAPVNVRYAIPFTIDVKRNHLYTVVLGVKAEGNRYVTSAEIKTLKWEDEIEVTTENVKLFTFTPSNTGFNYDAANRTMTLDNANADTYTDAFTVTSKYEGDDLVLVLETTKDGITFNPNNSWISASFSPGKVSISVEENTDDEPREGIIWFRSEKDTSKNQLYAIKVIQPKKK